MTRTRKPTAAQKGIEAALRRGFEAGWLERHYFEHGNKFPDLGEALKAFLDREMKRK